MNVGFLTVRTIGLALTLGAKFTPPLGPFIVVHVGDARLFWEVDPRVLEPGR